MLPAFFVFLPFVIFLLIFGCQAQLTTSRPCWEMPRTPDFNPKKILGRWYRYTYYHETYLGRCEQLLFKTDTDNITTMTEKRILYKPSETMEQQWNMKYIGDAAYFVISPNERPFYNQTLYFWSTDYTSYAIQGGCFNDIRARIQYYWVMMRDKFPSGSVIAQINKAMKDQGLQQHNFWRDNQTNCPSDW